MAVDSYSCGDGTVVLVEILWVVLMVCGYDVGWSCINMIVVIVKFMW